MGRLTLTLFFGSAKTKSKTETTTSLNSWILCLEGYWLTDSSLPLCFKVERISLLKPELLKLFLFHLFFKVFRDARKVSSRVSAVGADLWLWFGGRGRPDRRDSHWPGEPVLQSTQSYLWTPGWVQPVSLGANRRNSVWVIYFLGFLLLVGVTLTSSPCSYLMRNLEKRTFILWNQSIIGRKTGMFGETFPKLSLLTCILFDNHMKTRQKCASFAPLLAMVITPGETVWSHLSYCLSSAERTVLKILSSDQDASLWLKRFSLERHSSCKKVKMCSWSLPWTFSSPPTFSILNKHWVHS